MVVNASKERCANVRVAIKASIVTDEEDEIEGKKCWLQKLACEDLA